MDKVLIVGFGYIGRRVAELYRERRAAVSALGRDPEAAGCRQAGAEPVRGDLDRPATLTGLPTGGARVFYFAPPPTRGAADPRMAAFLAAAASAPPCCIVYISTSGVYGDRGGEWVDEHTAPAPTTDRARRRWDAEQQLREFGRVHDVRVIVLRVGGIYGPGRLPVARLKKGLPALREAECGYTNRIHADDLAQVCVAAADRCEDALYNVSDGQTGNMTEYFKAVADRLGLPRPPEISMEEAKVRLSDAMLSYLTESRRLDSRRMREALGVTLRFPDLAAGLAAIDPAEERGREGKD